MARIKVTGGIKTSGLTIWRRFNIPPAWNTVAGSLGTPFENKVFSVNPTATDPDSFPDPITYSVIGGSLPSGLSLNSSTGEISGTTDAVVEDSISNFTLSAADGPLGPTALGKKADRAFSITVLNDNPPSFNQPALTNIGSVAELAAASLAQITATDPNTNPQTITFSEVGAVLATENLSLDSSGNVTGTPTDSGGTRTITFSVRSSDGTLTTDQDFKVTITDAQDPVWVTAAGLLACVNESEAITTITLVATDSNPVSYTVTGGALPGGLSLNSSTGDITGTSDNVTTDTTFTFEVTATDTIELDTTLRCFQIKVLNVIANSLLLNDDDSAELTRTPPAGNQKTWTWSGWIKRGNIGINQGSIFSADHDVSKDGDQISFTVPGKLIIILRTENLGGASAGAVMGRIDTTQVLQDSSAWYHIVVTLDTTDGTSADRLRLYINGSRVTDFDTSTNPALNDEGYINAVTQHSIGGRRSVSFWDGYVSEINFVDGQSLTPTSFGAFDSNGDWQTKEYTGTYGTNGFHLEFKDSSPATDLGDDTSGNANDWTTNNIAASDQVSDSPTNNYCVLNPLAVDIQGDLEEGNLSLTPGTFGHNFVNAKGSFVVCEDKWYYEATVNNFAGSGNAALVGWTTRLVLETGTDLRITSGSFGIEHNIFSGLYDKVVDGVQGSTIATAASGDLLRIAIDFDAGKFWVQNFTDSATWIGGASDADVGNGISPTGTFTANTLMNPIVMTTVNFGNTNRSQVITNFGQTAFSQTEPTGFKALNSQNLPTPTIEDPSDHYSTVLYTGNGTAIGSGGNAITGVGFAAELVWIKDRATTPGPQSYAVFDTGRGATNRLSTDTIGAQITLTETLSTFDGDGFTVGSNIIVNETGKSFVSWNWNESATPGFDVITYTGTGLAHTESHSLSDDPKFIIVKKYAGTVNNHWRCFHTILGNTKSIKLSDTDSAQTSTTYWNDTDPTSSNFTVGTNVDLNESNESYVAYLWAEIKGFSRFSSYTGNSSVDGPFIWCGFRPAFVIIKNITLAGSSWIIQDSVRSTFNQVDLGLTPNVAGVEDAGFAEEFFSNGFRPATAASSEINASGSEYIFAAFAESPFKTARAR